MIGYIRRQLGAAWEMASFAGDPMERFDTGLAGFFRSFLAAVLCAPMMVLITAGQRRLALEEVIAGAPSATPPEPLTTAYVLIEAASYLVGWVAFPLAMILIAWLLAVSGRYVAYITAYNWCNCILVAVTTFAFLLFTAGLVSARAFEFMLLPILLFNVAYLWRVARLGLQVSVSAAAGIVVLDLLIAQFLAFASDAAEHALRAG